MTQDELERQLRSLPVVQAPDEIWQAISEAQRPGSWYLAKAAAIFVMLGASAWWITSGHSPTGRWIETGPAATTRIDIGTIGHVELAPSTRLRFVNNSPNSYRLALARGEIHATILAPPRLFIIDTPAAAVVDLGCEYTLRSNDHGDGLLKVITGWVSLEWANRTSLVPAGASCSTFAKRGPGIPYFSDASESFRNAVNSLDTDGMLNLARTRDTLTLWHLLQRVPESDRPRVFDRIAALSKLQVPIDRAKALQLDTETLKLWREELAWTW